MKALKRLTKGGDEKVTTKAQQPKEKPQLTASDLAVSCMHGTDVAQPLVAILIVSSATLLAFSRARCAAENVPPLLGAVAEVGKAGREAAEPEGAGLCPRVQCQ